MENLEIIYEILINVGTFKNQSIVLLTNLKELEYNNIDELLIQHNYLEFSCNHNEYTILNRTINL